MHIYKLVRVGALRRDVNPEVSSAHDLWSVYYVFTC